MRLAGEQKTGAGRWFCVSSSPSSLPSAGRRRNGDGILALPPPPLLCRRLEGREVPLESPSFTPTPTSRHNSRLLPLFRPPPCRQKCLPRKSNLAQN